MNCARLRHMARSDSEIFAMIDIGLRRLEMPFETASMGQIAAASELPRSSFYYRFANKDEVLAFLAEGMIGDLASAVETAYATSPRAVLRIAALVEAHLEHVAARPGVAQLLLVHFARLDLFDVDRRIDEAFHGPVAELLREANASGQLRVDDPDLASEALYGALTGVALRRIVRDGMLDVHDLSTRLLGVFGISAARTLTAELPRRRA